MKEETCLQEGGHTSRGNRGTQQTPEGSNLSKSPAEATDSNGPCVYTQEEEKMSKNGYVLRSRDVAHVLDCSPDEVIELAQSKKLKATKEGRFWKYRPADVVAYRKSLEKRA